MFKGHPALDTDDAFRLLDRLSGNVQELVLGGGDPLLRRDLVALVERAEAAGLGIEIQTNAQLLRSDFVRAVGNRIIRWGLSMDSAIPLLHDQIRGRSGNHNKVLEAASTFTELGLDWNLRTLVARPTLSTVAEIGEWLKSINFAGVWYLLQYSPTGDEARHRERFEISDEEFQLAVEPIAKRYAGQSFRTIAVPDSARQGIYFLIAPDGSVYNHPRSGEQYAIVGNILTSSFDELVTKLSVDFDGHYNRYGFAENASKWLPDSKT
jgi:MoaA/NifB/PqqE/SkfB family radical SAM enzyme